MVPEVHRQLTIKTTVDHHNPSEPQSADHKLSAQALATKLETLKREQERCSNMNHEGHHHRSQHSTSSVKSRMPIDEDLQKRAQDTIHEILEKLEHQRQESDFTYNPSLIPGIEDNTSGRLRHIHQVNPELLKETIYAPSIKQSHGNANLRHG
ncbi:hypothetical protein BGZ46_010739 [Entomortierella lignicola]|nr:hypothetical protein BGZ46_010739 [Entomortierella lignicola]